MKTDLQAFWPIPMQSRLSVKPVEAVTQQSSSSIEELNHGKSQLKL